MTKKIIYNVNHYHSFINHKPACNWQAKNHKLSTSAKFSEAYIHYNIPSLSIFYSPLHW